MRVRIEVDSIIESYVKVSLEQLKDLELSNDTSINQLLKQLTIPTDEIGMIIRNNRAIFDYDMILESGDEITIFSEINGG